jgi:YegS/Rv2252/BmrU family lipid kinase
MTQENQTREPDAAFAPHTWILVLNPVSGRGAGLRGRGRIEAALRAKGITFRSAVSEYAGHTTSVVRAAITAGCRNIVVAGGDGSLSEAANGILGQAAVASREIRLALIPVGTGNDWARMRAIPRDYPGAARVLAQGRTVLQDAGMIEFGAGGHRHFVNVAGAGFDAAVLEHMPGRRLGRLSYVVGLVRALLAYRPLPLRWRHGEGEGSAEAFLMFACNGRYCGGGMLVAPDARDDDGQLELVLVRHMPRLKVLRSLPLLFDGSIYGHPRVSHWTSTSVELSRPAGTFIEADGELVGQLPARVSVQRAALGVMVA